MEFDALHGSVCFIVPLTKTEIHPHVSISYRTNSGSRNSDEHKGVASISARSSDILRENYPHLCGNLSHLRISSSYILPRLEKNCNTFFKFFHPFSCKKKRFSTAVICAFFTKQSYFLSVLFYLLYYQPYHKSGKHEPLRIYSIKSRRATVSD